MIYLVTNQLSLFENPKYTIINVEESIALLEKFNVVQYDSETNGTNAHINSITCIQFGNKTLDTQIVVDTSTVNIQHYKTILESKYLIMQNGKFDLQFLYTNNIIPTKVYDTMIVEQLLYLGFPAKGQYGGIGFGLNDIAERYLGIYIDKSIREDFTWRGLDDATITYAANDVVYLEDIMQAQITKCKEKNCLVGAKLECDFVPVIAYLEWCGITLDEKVWTQKMDKDTAALEECVKELNDLAISWGDNRFFFINLQGDLFLGFDTTPKCTINWSSSKQVIEVAKFLGFNTKTQDKKTGNWKDSVEEKQLQSQKGINDEFLKKYFKYQECVKVCTTYGQNYLNAINPKTGRIHTKFRQLGASSGRMT